MPKELRYKIQVLNETGKLGSTKVFLDGHICEIILTAGIFLINGERIDCTVIRAPLTLNFPPVFNQHGCMVPYNQEIYLEPATPGGQIIIKQIYQN